MMTKQRYRKLRKLFRERISAGLLEATDSEAFLFMRLNSLDFDRLQYRADFIAAFVENGFTYQYAAPAHIMVKYEMRKLIRCQLLN